MNDLKFYCKYLALQNAAFDIDLFKSSIDTQATFVFHENGTYHSVDIKIDDPFVKMYLEYGNPLPRPDHVINTQTTENETNPRTQIQIEPRQMFILIDSRHSFAWLSNIKKANVLSTILE